MDERAHRSVRLQRFLAWCGKGSRRACEDLIALGRVQVDGVKVSEPGTKIVPGAQDVRVDGERVRPERRVCYLINKPRGFISSNAPAKAPRRVVDLVDHDPRRLYIAGRLDVDSDGLVLVTNDGELANRITHPRYGVHKTYSVLVRGRVAPETLRTLEKGVFLAEGKVRPSVVRIVGLVEKNTELEVTLTEGRNREVRRIFARVGHPVKRLTRTAIGPLRLGSIPPGQAESLPVDRAWAALAGARARAVEGKRAAEPADTPAKKKKGGKGKGWAKAKPRKKGGAKARWRRKGRG